MIVHEWRADAADSADPAEHGRRFGAAWAPQLAAARDAYAQLFAQLFAQSGAAPEVVRDVVDGCRAATERHAPAVAAELAGMARGAGLTTDDIYLLTARTEIIARTRSGMECSTVVHLPADGSAPRTLQTWDWHADLSNESIVRAFTAASGARVVTFHEFGQPAKIGVNDRGLGIHFNILHHRTDGTQAGVPVHVLARMMLDDAATVDEAVAIARSVPLAASSVITAVEYRGGAGRAAAIEVSPAGIAAIEAPHGETFAHTNHFLDPALAAGENLRDETTTHPRYACLVDAADLARIADPRERALAFGAIADAPISVHAQPDAPPLERWETKLTVALDVDGAALEFAAASPARVADAAWCRVGV